MIQDEVEVVDAPERSQFEISVGGERVGLARYQLGDGRITFVHTEIDDAWGGRGLASRLAGAALDSARERGLTVTPRCPYIAGWIRKHPEYVELVDPDERARVTP